MIPKEIIIIGGGQSIADGLSTGLKDKLNNKFVIGCNSAFKDFDCTMTTILDTKFYLNNLKDLKCLPLIICPNNNDLCQYKLPNTFLLKKQPNFYKDCLIKGFYRGGLTGCFSTTIASFLTDWDCTIFLLGFDFGSIDGKTHYHNHKNHNGIGNLKAYAGKKSTVQFGFFAKEPQLTIYNVSPKSNLTDFKKINYNEFYTLLTQETYDQNNLRQLIKEKLCVSTPK